MLFLLVTVPWAVLYARCYIHFLRRYNTNFSRGIPKLSKKNRSAEVGTVVNMRQPRRNCDAAGGKKYPRKMENLTVGRDLVACGSLGLPLAVARPLLGPWLAPWPLVVAVSGASGF